MAERLIQPSEAHRTIDGSMLANLREKADLTQQQLAMLCAGEMKRDSLTQQMISQIECPGKHEIPADLAMALQKILTDDL